MTVPALAAPLLDSGLGARRLRAAHTLDDAICALWARIGADRAVECPLCQGEMEPEYSAEGLQVDGRCQDCGTVLS